MAAEAINLFPLLGKEGTTDKLESPPWKGGEAAPSIKWSRSFAGADGVVGSTSDNRCLDLPPRLRPLRRLRGIFLMGAATPPWLRRGIRLSPGYPRPPVSSGALVGNDQLDEEGNRFVHTF